MTSLAAGADSERARTLKSIASTTGAGEGALSGGYCAGITALAHMPATDVVVSGSGDGFLRFWRLVSEAGGSDSTSGTIPTSSGGAFVTFKSLEHIFALPCKGIINGLSFSSDGRTLAVAVGTEHRLGRWWRYKEAKNGLAIVTFPQQFK